MIGKLKLLVTIVAIVVSASPAPPRNVSDLLHLAPAVPGDHESQNERILCAKYAPCTMKNKCNNANYYCGRDLNNCGFAYLCFPRKCTGFCNSPKECLSKICSFHRCLSCTG